MATSLELRSCSRCHPRLSSPPSICTLQQFTRVHIPIIPTTPSCFGMKRLKEGVMSRLITFIYLLNPIGPLYLSGLFIFICIIPLMSPSTHPCHFPLCHPSFCTWHLMPSCGCFLMHHYSNIPAPQTFHWLTVDYVHRFCFISSVSTILFILKTCYHWGGRSKSLSSSPQVNHVVPL